MSWQFQPMGLDGGNATDRVLLHAMFGFDWLLVLAQNLCGHRVR